MSETEDFLQATLVRLEEAERRLHDGDPEPRLAMWSRDDPVTVLGALGVYRNGWAELEPVFRDLAAGFSDCTSYELELLAAWAGGDVAYTVALEHSVRSWKGGPPQASTVRATHVYRREDGEWKIVHRHGDALEADRDSSLDEVPLARG